MDSVATKTDKFADYFVICGLDLKSGLESDRLAGLSTYITFEFMYHRQCNYCLNSIKGESQLQDTPLERSYKCKVLAHYPENVARNHYDNDAICMVRN